VRTANLYRNPFRAYRPALSRSLGHTKALSRKIWVVPVTNMPLWHPDEAENIRRATIDPSTLDDFPPWMMNGEYFLVDQTIPQCCLGTGVNEYVVTVSDNTSVPSLSSGALSSHETLIALPQGRMLQKRTSQTEEDAAEQIASDTKAAFHSGNFLSTPTKSALIVLQPTTSRVLKLIHTEIVCSSSSENSAVHGRQTGPRWASRKCRFLSRLF